MTTFATQGGFGSASLQIVENATFFQLQKGFSSASLELLEDTFFALQKGFSSAGLGIGISIGRVFIGPTLYTPPLSITITSAQGSYVVTSQDGYFTIYPYVDGSYNEIELVITAGNAQYSGTLTITPTVPAVFDLFLMSIVGMATKLMNVPILGIAQGLFASDFCKCAYACDYVEKAFAGDNYRTNDTSSFLYRKLRTADTITLALHRRGVAVASLNSNTYGTYYASFASQPLYVGFIVDWGLVFTAFGGGQYEVVANKTLLGVATIETSRRFYLNSFDEMSANNTVKIEIRQNGNILSSPFDFTNLLAGGWPSAYRIPGSFGKRSPSFNQDSYESSDRSILAVQPSLQFEYTLSTHLLPSYIADVLSTDVPLSDSILISEYGLLSPRMYDRLPVSPVSVELKEQANGQEVYECVFSDAKNNTLRQY